MMIYFIELIVGVIIACVGAMAVYNVIAESEDDNND